MIIFGKKGAETIGRSQREIMEKLFNESEAYMKKTLFKALGMSEAGFPDELDEENVKIVNDALAYWKQSKSLALASAELQDQRESDMRSSLKEIQEELKNQRKLLEELTRRKDK